MTLDNFPGDVIVERCTFKNNLYRFDKCLNWDPREPGSVSSIMHSVSYSNNFDLVHRSPGQTHSSIQIKALMNIMNHNKQLGLLNNTFVNNTALKGVLNIDRNPT